MIWRTSVIAPHMRLEEHDPHNLEPVPSSRFGFGQHGGHGILLLHRARNADLPKFRQRSKMRSAGINEAWWGFGGSVEDDIRITPSQSSQPSHARSPDDISRLVGTD